MLFFSLIFLLFEILFAHNDADLQEAGVGSLGLEERASLFLDSGWERELYLGVMHLLDGSATGVLSGDRLHTDDLKNESTVRLCFARNELVQNLTLLQTIPHTYTVN
jgi:hypothetical protein